MHIRVPFYIYMFYITHTFLIAETEYLEIDFLATEFDDIEDPTTEVETDFNACFATAIALSDMEAETKRDTIETGKFCDHDIVTTVDMPSLGIIADLPSPVSKNRASCLDPHLESSSLFSSPQEISRPDMPLTPGCLSSDVQCSTSATDLFTTVPVNPRALAVSSAQVSSETSQAVSDLVDLELSLTLAVIESSQASQVTPSATLSEPLINSVANDMISNIFSTTVNFANGAHMTVVPAGDIIPARPLRYRNPSSVSAKDRIPLLPRCKLVRLSTYHALK